MDSDTDNNDDDDDADDKNTYSDNDGSIHGTCMLYKYVCKYRNINLQTSVYLL